MERKEWLKTLKIGDKVANKDFNTWRGEVYYDFLEVKNITAKGNIRLTNGVLLDDNGEYFKSSNLKSIYYKIEPITDSIIKYENERKEKETLVSEIGELFNKFNRKNYTVEELKQIRDILNK